MSDFEVIRSRQNPLCQKIRKLRSSRSFRYETGLFLADGVKLVSEALKWNYPVEALVLSENTEFQEPAGVNCFRVSEEIMEYVSSMETPQGVLAVCRLPGSACRTVQKGSLILDGIQDPGNLGTVIRTADALNVPLYLLDNCADPYNEKTVRASMGAVFRSAPAVISKRDFLESVEILKLPLAVTTFESDSVDVRTLHAREYVWAIGNEGHGISRELLDAASRHVVIPMNPRCESLNAAAAATIIMWQMNL